MPQFDKVAFFTQIIWSLLVFSSFYALNFKRSFSSNGYAYKNEK